MQIGRLRIAATSYPIVHRGIHAAITWGSPPGVTLGVQCITRRVYLVSVVLVPRPQPEPVSPTEVGGKKNFLFWGDAGTA